MAKNGASKPKPKPKTNHSHKPAAKSDPPAKPVAKTPPKAVAAKVVPAEPPKPKPRNAFQDKIIHLIGEEMAIEEAELTPNASLREDLGLDEIDVAELLMQAEHTFSLSPFSETDWEGCETVGDFTQLVQGRMDTKSRSGKKG